MDSSLPLRHFGVMARHDGFLARNFKCHICYPEISGHANMIVAVTGGTGFIGKNLVARLVARGDTVRLLTRGCTVSEKSSLVEVHQCDLVTASIGDLSSVLDGVDVLYHCAGQLTNPQEMR